MTITAGSNEGTLITVGVVVTMNAARTIFQNGAVLVPGERIESLSRTC